LDKKDMKRNKTSASFLKILEANKGKALIVQ